MLFNFLSILGAIKSESTNFTKSMKFLFHTDNKQILVTIMLLVILYKAIFFYCYKLTKSIKLSNNLKVV